MKGRGYACIWAWGRVRMVRVGTVGREREGIAW